MDLLTVSRVTFALTLSLPSVWPLFPTNSYFSLPCRKKAGPLKLEGGEKNVFSILWLPFAPAAVAMVTHRYLPVAFSRASAPPCWVCGWSFLCPGRSQKATFRNPLFLLKFPSQPFILPAFSVSNN